MENVGKLLAELKAQQIKLVLKGNNLEVVSHEDQLQTDELEIDHLEVDQLQTDQIQQMKKSEVGIVLYLKILIEANP